LKKNNYFYKKGGLQNNTFEQSKSREITTNLETVYINNIKITTNSENEDKKLFYFPKKNKIIYSDDNNNNQSGIISSPSTNNNTNKNNTRREQTTGFSLNYLGKIQRKSIEEHLAQGKTLKCHHQNCKSFINNKEFTTLYDYNIHYYNSNHSSQPIHPELPLIELLGLEPVGNPWEEVVKNDTYLPLSNSSKLDKKLIEDYHYDEEVDNQEGGLEEYF